eukprot:357242-Chlamydomonas_euryale.AAC.4
MSNCNQRSSTAWPRPPQTHGRDQRMSQQRTCTRQGGLQPGAHAGGPAAPIGQLDSIPYGDEGAALVAAKRTCSSRIERRDGTWVHLGRGVQPYTEVYSLVQKCTAIYRSVQPYSSQLHSWQSLVCSVATSGRSFGCSAADCRQTPATASCPVSGPLVTAWRMKRRALVKAWRPLDTCVSSRWRPERMSSRQVSLQQLRRSRGSAGCVLRHHATQQAVNVARYRLAEAGQGAWEQVINRIAEKRLQPATSWNTSDLPACKVWTGCGGAGKEQAGSGHDCAIRATGQNECAAKARMFATKDHPFSMAREHACQQTGRTPAALAAHAGAAQTLGGPYNWAW